MSLPARPSHRGILRTNVQPSRVEALEDKLDGLVAQVAALAQQNAQLRESSAREPLLPTPSDGSHSTSPSTAARDRTVGAATSIHRGLDNSSGHLLSTTTDDSVDPISLGFLSSDQAAQLLSRYVALSVPQFPFVVPPTSTLADLRQGSPCLCAAVLGSAMYDFPARQAELGEALWVLFVRTALLRSERSLDLLQALLVWLAWYHFLMPPREQKLYVMTQLAIDLLYALQLDKPVREEPVAHSNVLSEGQTRVVHSLAEKRALLGVYWTSSK